MKKVLFLLFFGLFSVFGFTQNIEKNSEKSIDFQKLDAYIQSSVEKFNLTGLSFAFVQNDSVLFSKAYGLKNTKTGEILNTSSLFNIASCSKAFTAACVTKLVHEKKLNWDDKVITYLPDFKLADDYITQNLSIEDLLCHRSGLGTFYGDLLWYQTHYSQTEIIERMRYLPIKRTYRTQYGYQNDMYLVAGKIIEKVSGQTWGEYLKQNILKPLAMSETRVASKYLSENQDLAMPHLNRNLENLYIIDEHAALSMYSSVEELSNWVRMLLGNGSFNGYSVLSPEMVHDLFSARTLLPVSTYHQTMGTYFRAYALGWSTFDYFGKKIVEHDGGMPGYISKVTLIPQLNAGFVILTNDMNYLSSGLKYKILDMMLNDQDKDWAEIFLDFQKAGEREDKQKIEKKYAERKLNTQPDLKLKEYAGTYTDKMYGDAEITFSKDKLTLTLLPAKEVFTSPMTHWHNNSFHIKFKDNFLPEGWIHFSINENNEIEGFTIDLENPDFHFFNLNFVKKK